MLPVSSSQQLLGLSPPLPLELVKVLLTYLDEAGLFAVAETSKGGRWLLDEEAGSATLWRVRYVDVGEVGRVTRQAAVSE